MNKAWYALRRTIVPHRFKQLADELLEKLPEMGIDELIAKVDAEEFTHGQPSLEWVEDYCRKLKALKKKIEAKGIVFSINPWITFGHNDRGRDGRAVIPGLRTMVGHDGVKCTCCACPLSQAWREHIKKVWGCYARLEPTVIWLEDDLRTFGHHPIIFSCFCSEHLKRFSKLVGQKVSREELVLAVLKKGKPHPWRKTYLDMQRDVILEAVGIITQTVNDISPATSIGLMSSGPRNHCMEGRDWSKLAKTMTVGPKLFSRPTLGNYWETSFRELYYSADSIKLTRHVLPAGTVEQTEIENVPFTQYSKSATMTFVQMAMSFALGCDGVTMNLFDHCGSLMADDPETLGMLGREKQYLNSLAAATQGPGRQRGVQILFSEKHGYGKRLAKDVSLAALKSEDQWLPITLETLGLPVTYSDEKVRATTGQVIRNFSDDEIMQFLSDGLFLDAAAACVLVERGFGEYIGLSGIEVPRCVDDIEPLSAEEFHNRSFGGAKGKMMTMLIPSLDARPTFSQADILPEAKIISHLVDSDAMRKYPAMYAYENCLGGRAVVHLLEWEKACGVAFNNAYRRQQLQNAVRWLGRGTLVAAIENVCPLLIRRDVENQTILIAFNFILDDYPSFAAEIADTRKIKSVHILSLKGKWQKSEYLTINATKKGAILIYNKPLSHRRPLVCRITFDA